MKQPQKQQINLYTDALKPKRELLSLRNLLGALAVLLVLALILRGVTAWQQIQLEQERAELTDALNAVQQDIGQLAREHRARRVDASLERRVDDLRDEVEELQALTGALEGAQRGQFVDENYATILRDLSDIHLQGLWLTHIENRQGRLVLRGQTMNAAFLPRWMARFERTTSLQGRQFAVVALERDDRELLSFELRSERIREREVSR